MHTVIAFLVSLTKFSVTFTLNFTVDVNIGPERNFFGLWENREGTNYDKVYGNHNPNLITMLQSYVAIFVLCHFLKISRNQLLGLGLDPQF